MTRYVLVGVVTLVTACATAGVAGPADGGNDASVHDDAAPIDAPNGSACASADTCAMAMPLGSVSGDSGNQKLAAMGYRAAWFRVRVTEDDSGPLGQPLHVAAKLTSPAGASFDAFVYVNGASDVVECATPTGMVTTTANVKQTDVEWGEGAIPNGADDSRDVSIEIRPASGTCAPGQMWQLEVAGAGM